MHIVAGTDTYGRVKTVGGTPIVTKFAMFQFLPVYPVQSFYYAGPGRTETSGIPFVASSQTVAIRGVPLARVDRLSAAMAYTRAIFGTMAVFGFMAIVPLVMQLTGEHLDDFATSAMRVLVGCFLAGTAGGLLTYAIPLTPGRERRIRRCCGELLGMAVDPARVAADASAAIEEYAALAAPREIPATPRFALLQQLATVRSRIARRMDVDAMEWETDQLLDRLDHPGRHAE